jgi:hypothetical protein
MVSDFRSLALLPYPSGFPEKEPFYYLLKFSVNGTPQVPQWAPMERDNGMSPIG